MLESHHVSTLPYPPKPFWPYSDNSCMLTRFKLNCKSQWYKIFIHPCTSLFSYSLPTGRGLSPSREWLWLAWAQGLGSGNLKPELSKARPKPWLPGQAGPSHHYSAGLSSSQRYEGHPYQQGLLHPDLDAWRINQCRGPPLVYGRHTQHGTGLATWPHLLPTNVLNAFGGARKHAAVYRFTIDENICHMSHCGLWLYELGVAQDRMII